MVIEPVASDRQHLHFIDFLLPLLLFDVQLIIISIYKKIIVYLLSAGERLQPRPAQHVPAEGALARHHAYRGAQGDARRRRRRHRPRQGQRALVRQPQLTGLGAAATLLTIAIDH